MPPSFARYAALLAGVLDGAEEGAPACADAALPTEAERQTLDQATRRAACSLRRPAPAPPRVPPSPMSAAYRGVPAPTLPAGLDAHLDRRG